jgi:hypothetical protein
MATDSKSDELSPDHNDANASELAHTANQDELQLVGSQLKEGVASKASCPTEGTVTPYLR